MRRLPSHGFCLKIKPPRPNGPAFYEKSMKNEFSFLFPYPRHVLVRDDSLDIRDLCFPLEIYKKYDFLFEFFNVRNKNRGLEILFQEEPGAGCRGIHAGQRPEADPGPGPFHQWAVLLPGHPAADPILLWPFRAHAGLFDPRWAGDRHQGICFCCGGRSGSCRSGTCSACC